MRPRQGANWLGAHAIKLHKAAVQKAQATGAWGLRLKSAQPWLAGKARMKKTRRACARRVQLRLNSSEMDQRL
jgi:hypothetical protein